MLHKQKHEIQNTEKTMQYIASDNILKLFLKEMQQFWNKGEKEKKSHNIT